MEILVDYDNVLEAHRKYGPMDLIKRILAVLGADNFSSNPTAQFRFYGGWYEDRVLSRRAQALVPDLQSSFPAETYLSKKPGTLRVKTQAELAYSLVIEPSKHIWHTLRRRPGHQHGLRCEEPSKHGCINGTCPLVDTRRFLHSGKCPTSNCTVTAEQLLYKQEQKLVDTMLTSDLIFLSQSGTTQVAIVSSDDDFWPGIRTATLLGAEVFHIHTRPKHHVPLGYLTGSKVGANYHQLHL